MIFKTTAACHIVCYNDNNYHIFTSLFINTAKLERKRLLSTLDILKEDLAWARREIVSFGEICYWVNHDTVSSLLVLGH